MENNLNTMYISYKEEIHKITQLQKSSNINWLINNNAKHWDILVLRFKANRIKTKQAKSRCFCQKSIPKWIKCCCGC